MSVLDVALYGPDGCARACVVTPVPVKKDIGMAEPILAITAAVEVLTLMTAVAGYCLAYMGLGGRYTPHSIMAVCPVDHVTTKYGGKGNENEPATARYWQGYS